MSLKLFVFIMMAAFSAGAQEVGVNVHLPVNTVGDPSPQLDRAVEMRLMWGRMDLRWDFVEANPMDDVATEGNWQVIDASVKAMRERGMQVLAIIAGTPSWASTNGADNGTFNDAGIEHYRRFVRAIVQRYRHDIDSFEIFNEPNLTEFYVGTVDTYVDQMVIPAREEIKKLHPEARVVGPSLANLINSRIKVEDFLKRLGERQKDYKTQTGQKFFDVISHHTYNNTPQEVIEEFTKGRKSCVWMFCIRVREPILNIYSKNGFTDEVLWLTEFGWTADRSDADQTKQANMLLETVRKLGQVPRLQLAFIYHLQDDPRFPSDYGLLFGDSSPKKVYFSLRDR